jgi:hypothetical protein
MAQARRGGRRRQCGGYGSSPKAGRRVLPKAANSHSDRPRVLPDYRRLHRAMHEPPHLELYAPGLITALQTHVRRQGLPRSWREVRAAYSQRRSSNANSLRWPVLASRRELSRHLKYITRTRIPEIAVGTLITERPPHRTVRAQFGHTACMGLSLSRVHHAIFVARCYSILLFDPRGEHSSIPTAHCRRRRAQWRSRTALRQRRRRLVLDGREHGGRLPVIGWSAAR